jgi:crotonobetainyl-CoA:carnitine CoA-transferase CaiB-like acyl-CoA transferase
VTPPVAPLSGITLVEAMSAECPLALRLSAALAGRIAADLGARVVMLEPLGGSPLRTLPPLAPDGGSAVFAFLAAGKRSALDAPAAAAGILGGADAILADTGRADLPAKAGCRVLLSMLPAIAARGPAATAPQTEFTIMALGGLLDIVGDPDGRPMRLGGHQLAYAGGLAAYAALAAALLRRPATEVARVALLEVAVWINWKSVASVAALGTTMTRSGRAADWPVLRCADGHVALVHQPGDWPALRRLCGDTRLDEPRFADPASRRRHAHALADIIESALGHLTRAELQARAMALRLPLGPIWQIAELRRDTQLLGRGFLDGPLGTPRLPVLWNGAAFPVGPVPADAAARGATA